MSLFRRYLRGLRDHLRDALYALKGEWLLAPDTRRRLSGARGVSLNVGAGALSLPGFVNLDRFPASPEVLYWDFRKPLPLADAAVRHVHCEHFIEHLEHHDALALLAEFRRVLEPGGTLRLICPDAGRYIRAYCAGDAAFFRALERLGGAAKPFEHPIEVINQMFRMAGAHRFAWDYEALEAALAGVGFVGIRRSSIGEPDAGGEVDGRDDWREIESLYVVARAPSSGAAAA
jgi:predicted SAM-dependent methyltransferase